MCVEEGCLELWRIVWRVGRTGATCNDQRERMPWREFRVGGMGVCLAEYASAYLGSKGMGTCWCAHAVEYRVYSSSCASALAPAPVGVAVPVRYASPSLGARRTSRGIEPTSGAVGVERHYSIWKGLYGP